MRLAFAIFWLMLLALPAAAQELNCLACHGEKAMSQQGGRSIFVDPAKHKGSVHGSLGCNTCHDTITEYPHPQKNPKPDCASCHVDAGKQVSRSAHAALGPAPASCATCHGEPHYVRSAASLKPAATGSACATCHADSITDYQKSVHAMLRKNGDNDSATCQSCHGAIHTVIAHREPNSPVAKKNLPATCGACHANPDFLARHRIPFARPVEAFRLSVHGRAIEAGNNSAASCSDCHGSHGIIRAREGESKINHWNVPQTCGGCHNEIGGVYKDSVHGQAVARGVSGAPVCTDCHGEHSILAPSEPQSLVNPARVSTVTCGRCHADERLARRYNLPLDKVPAFEDSFHGLALRSGSQTVANCASCHGVHNILASSDARSTVHPANLSSTCGACHAGAGQRFAIGRVHVVSATASEHPVVKFIRVSYLLLIPLTIGFMALHHGADFITKMIRGRMPLHTAEQAPRMGLHYRIAHWMVVVSFPSLVITGFALKYPEAWWAAPLLRWESQFALRGTLHRAMGVLLVAALAYHVIHLIVSRRRCEFVDGILPRLKDLRDLKQMLAFNLGRGAERPRFDKFSYAEKIEYWAFMWGTLVMTVTGAVLWFNDFSLRNFPKWVSDAATALHFYEAILATFSILIWHFYLVIFDPDVYPMDRAWLTGKTSADHLKHTRPEYYLDRTLAEVSKGQASKTEKAPPASVGSNVGSGVDSSETPADATPDPPSSEKKDAGVN